jgi:isoleucyl-tRNA synthetase
VLVLGDYVTLDAGTGLVHTAPGHGADDFHTGQRYGLEIYTPVNHRGEFTQDVANWAGLHVFKANPLIVELMRERGVLVYAETVTHQYPHCWRCKNPIIFRATEQWFISMEETGLRKRALEEIGKVKWVPSWGVERITGMVQNRPDWCISRQRMWGVPITVLTCEKCNESNTSPELFARVAELFRKEGADAWYDHPAADFLPVGHKCRCGSTEFRKELDILDVWFDSGSSHIAVCKRRPELKWPATVYIEGHDQHRGWFQSSLLIGTGVEGGAPFEQVITHGFVVDEKGRKMSKSLGNVVSPQDVMKQNGADILRLWVAMIDYRDDMALGKEIISRIAEAYRKIRNTARYLLANLNDFDPSKALPVDQMAAVDRWILDRAARAFERCQQAYGDYEFHLVYHRLLELCTVDLSAVYLDASKDTMYCDAPDSISRRSAQTAMDRILRGLVTTIAPILSFTAEEIYEAMPGQKAKSVHLVDFERFEGTMLSAEDAATWDRLFRLREVVTKVLERARAAQQIGQSLEADVILHTDASPEALLGNVKADLAKLFIVSHVDFKPSDAGVIDAVDLEGIGRVAVMMAPARGRKCGRCWQYREEVTEEGGLCGRCQSVLDQLAPPVSPTI